MGQLFTIAYLLNMLENPFAFAAAAAFCALLLSFLNRNYALSFFLSIALTFGVTHIIKSIYKVARPQDALAVAQGYRFPSMHASLAAAVLTSLAWYWFFRLESTLARTLLIFGASGIVIFIGWTRVLLRVHETIDVVVGILLGVGISLTLHYLMMVYHLD